MEVYSVKQFLLQDILNKETIPTLNETLSSSQQKPNFCRNIFQSAIEVDLCIKLSHPVLSLFAVSPFHFLGKITGKSKHQKTWDFLTMPCRSSTIMNYILTNEERSLFAPLDCCMWAQKGLSAFSNQVTSSLLNIGFWTGVKRDQQSKDEEY